MVGGRPPTEWQGKHGVVGGASMARLHIAQGMAKAVVVLVLRFRQDEDCATTLTRWGTLPGDTALLSRGPMQY